MKHLKLFFALFAMLALGVGNAWGADYSATHTSNVTFTAGTNGSDAKVKINSIEYDAMKLGTSSKTGTMTFKIPVGTTKIHLHVAGWKSKNTKLNLSANNGVTLGTTSITSTADDGVTSNSPFTLATPANATTSYYKVVEITSGATVVETTITIQTTSTGYRAVVWGVNAETESGDEGNEEPVPSLTLDPTSKDFATVMVGEEASQEFTITPKNTTATLSAGISDETNYAISGIENNKITVTYKPQSAADKHDAVLTVKAGEEATATVNLTGKAVQALEGTWELVTDASILKNGDQVIIAAKESDIALSTTQNNNNRAGVEVTKSGNIIAATSATQVLTLVDTEDSDVPFALQAGSSYLYAASSSGNQLKTKAELDDNGKWVITITDGTASVVASKSSNRNVMQYNPNNENPIFTCYSSASQSALSLYRKAGTKYNVTVSSTTNGTVTADPTSAEAGTTITLTVTPAGGYVLDALTVTDASSNTIEVADNKFTMPASDVTVTATFKENEKPAATLTLSKNGVTETFPGSWKQDDVVTLPSITSDCVKEFVGWSANPTCNVAPEYAAGDSYTLAATVQTLYAVYATAGAGETLTITPSAVSGSADPYTFTIDAAGYSLTAKKNGGSTAPTYNEGKADARVYAKGTLTLTAENEMSTIVFNLSAQGKSRLPQITSSVGTIATQANGDATVTWTGDATEVTFTVGEKAVYTNDATQNGQFCFENFIVTTAPTYSNYSTTCAAAPIATVNPTSVTANSTGVEGKVTVTYENVNTANVAVALYNDEACTETFTAGWLTASLDGDKNIAYTVVATTLYTERKAYIQLTAPEANGTTEPAKVVIPVTQAGKDKVFASLKELLANITPTTEGVEVTVTLTNELIVDFYTSNSYRNGIALNVPYQDGTKQIEIYCKDVPADWVKGGKVSGTITCPWKLYNSTWELCPTAWNELTYTAPATVKSIAVSGNPTKTTYVDGEVFDPAGLVVTATLTDDSTEPIEFALVDWTFDPATLAKGQTSVSVTATYNSVTSAAYEVTGLTVNDIPTKTVAEFIAAGGTRCYLEGIVSGLTEGNSMKYGNFDLTDASGTIYVYGCLNEAGEKQKFAELGVKNGDMIKVIADEYELYEGTKDEAIDVQYVSHISAATITISDITMEVDEVATITATVDPVDAVVTYTIKENAANAISLSGNTITAKAEGTATITATVADGATYLGNSVDFTVTVGPKAESEEVVILAEYNGNWYALKAATGSGSNSLAALEVTYFNGILYNVAEADKASITWTRTIVGNQVTFKNEEKYLTGGSSTGLSLANASFEWIYKVEDGQDTYIYEYEDKGTIKSRTFLYYKDGYFKNYATSNAKPTQTDYSGYPVVTAPVYATGDIVYTRTVTNGKYGTICLPYGSTNYSGATFFEIAYKETGKVYIDEVTTLEAGVPYIFQANSSTLTVTCEGEAVGDAGSANGLYGTFTEIADVAVHTSNKGYILTNNLIRFCEANCNVPANRAYIVLDEISTEQTPAPVNRRRVGMNVEGENVETGVENLFTTEVPAKVIENGQLIIIRDGVKYNVQGQKL